MADPAVAAASRGQYRAENDKLGGNAGNTNVRAGRRTTDTVK